jgi:hypothetical protein
MSCLVPPQNPALEKPLNQPGLGEQREGDHTESLNFFMGKTWAVIGQVWGVRSRVIMRRMMYNCQTVKNVRGANNRSDFVLDKETGRHL